MNREFSNRSCRIRCTHSWIRSRESVSDVIASVSALRAEVRCMIKAILLQDRNSWERYQRERRSAVQMQLVDAGPLLMSIIYNREASTAARTDSPRDGV